MSGESAVKCKGGKGAKITHMHSFPGGRSEGRELITCIYILNTNWEVHRTVCGVWGNRREASILTCVCNQTPGKNGQVGRW